MIGHQTIGVTDPGVARNNLSECFNKQLAVGVIKKDLLARVSATRQMINRAREFQPKRPRHSRPISNPFVGLQDLTPNPPQIPQANPPSDPKSPKSRPPNE